MYTVTIGPYTIALGTTEPPSHYAEFWQAASLVEEFDLRHTEGDFCYLVAGHDLCQPVLILAQRYEPTSDFGSSPGILFVPETELLFVGAGTRLLAYDLAKPARLWEDEADLGFWSWARYSDTILMSAELELAAWNTKGDKLWSMVVEPPWSYDIADDTVTIDVMGTKTKFPLEDGPAA